MLAKRQIILLFCILIGGSLAALRAACQPTASANVLTLDQARQYMVMLINRDRAANGSKPLALDPVAMAAGQVHTDDMVQNGFFGHYDLIGRQPTERYTLLGGRGKVTENTNYLGASERTDVGYFILRRQPHFQKRLLEKFESDFVNERAPNDLHRRIVLDPAHNGIGIGLSSASDQSGRHRIACAEEFTNNLGEFADLPREITGRQQFVVSGRLAAGLELQSILVKKEPLPRPLTVEQVNQLHAYVAPTDTVLSYFPPPADSAAPVSISPNRGGMQFSVTVTPTSDWQPSLYYVEVWAHERGANATNNIAVSVRAITCRTSKHG